MKWNSQFANVADNIRLHYVRAGSGQTVLLLHGWPGFWYDWRHVIPLLSDAADVIAVDFRGFGESSKPDLPPGEAYTPQHLVSDIVALLDQLGIGSVTLAAHDIGATMAQQMALSHPERVRDLVLLNPPYPGIGSRRFEPNAQKEMWYQHFHHLDIAGPLIGHNRDTVEIYLSHFYNHWVGVKEALVPEEFEAIVDMYARPQAFEKSIQYYRARAASKSAATTPQVAPKILQPTTVLWGTHDPVIPSTWSDRLPEYFANLRLEYLEGIGHFVPMEAPREVASAVRSRLTSS